ncbi:MAG: hydrolase 1, exosortase A system-associated [Alphaproteobacteria bacterium]|nr:MAG: hydrolase 1, exosortase A system-associated [Alphaproteobacteria bacterium]
MASEHPFVFDCQGDRLLGVLHKPDQPARIGLLILVGGPQYRVGACRQYVHLARRAASRGIAAMRFDYRGVGDSEGRYPGFQAVGPDIDAAIREFTARVPEMEGVVPWGLCEGASAILLSAVDNARVRGAVLANPWVNTRETQAQTYLKHYYGDRLWRAETWKRLFKGEIHLGRSVRSVFDLTRKAFVKGSGNGSELPYPARMAAGFARFSGDVLLIMSERDLVAREFDEVVSSRPEWEAFRTSSRVRRIDVRDSDHTFSRTIWRDVVADATSDFILDLARKGC